MTMAARRQAERKTSGYWSKRVANRRQSLGGRSGSRPVATICRARDSAGPAPCGCGGAVCMDQSSFSSKTCGSRDGPDGCMSSARRPSATSASVPGGGHAGGTDRDRRSRQLADMPRARWRRARVVQRPSSSGTEGPDRHREGSLGFGDGAYLPDARAVADDARRRDTGAVEPRVIAEIEGWFDACCDRVIGFHETLPPLVPAAKRKRRGRPKGRNPALPRRPERALHRQRGRTEPAHGQGATEGVGLFPDHCRSRRGLHPPDRDRDRAKAGLGHSGNPGNRPRTAHPESSADLIPARNHGRSAQGSWAVI